MKLAVMWFCFCNTSTHMTIELQYMYFQSANLGYCNVPGIRTIAHHITISLHVSSFFPLIEQAIQTSPLISFPEARPPPSIAPKASIATTPSDARWP